MRWPFGPPHLTLTPSKKKTKNKKQKQKTKKQTKKTKKQEKVKKHKNTKKELFSYQSNFSFFGGGVSKNCLFWLLGPENAHPQNTIKIGVSAYFLKKKLCVTKRPFLDQKNPNPEIPVIISFCLFLFQQQKTPKLAETPIL